MCGLPRSLMFEPPAACRRQSKGICWSSWSHEGKVYAVDNQCPHMGFPLDCGSVQDGVLTCHWHHARFDLSSGGTFDQWADELRVYPVEIRGVDIWVDLGLRADPLAHQRRREFR